MIKKTNDEYLPLSIKINARHALDIRKNIITATAKTFQPHLFIVDKEPLGLKKEILPTLQWFQEMSPGYPVHSRTAGCHGRCGYGQKRLAGKKCIRAPGKALQ